MRVQRFPSPEFSRWGQLGHGNLTVLYQVELDGTWTETEYIIERRNVMNCPQPEIVGEIGSRYRPPSLCMEYPSPIADVNLKSFVTVIETHETLICNQG
jgi:hypothetical protein